MGNQTSKGKEKEGPPLIGRSPLRNRDFSSSNKHDEINLEFCNEELSYKNEVFYLDLISNRENTRRSIARSVSETVLNEINIGKEGYHNSHENNNKGNNSLESQRKEISNTASAEIKEKTKAKSKSDLSKRRSKPRSKHNPHQFEAIAEDSQDCRPDERRNRKRQKRYTEQHTNLVIEIMNTIIKLESTLLDEQKYEQRLRQTLTDQIESIQSLNLALNTERDRNNRLMTLLNHYDDPSLNFPGETEEPDNTALLFNDGQLSKRRDELEKCSKLKSRLCTSAREELFYKDNNSISPLRMEQCYDELTKSYAKCQAELRKKTKLLTVALCKQETLQARCDKLTEEFFESQKYIETMREKLVVKNQKKRGLKFRRFKKPITYQSKKLKDTEELTAELSDYNKAEKLVYEKSWELSTETENVIEKSNKRLEELAIISRSTRKSKAE